MEIWKDITGREWIHQEFDLMVDGWSKVHRYHNKDTFRIAQGWKRPVARLISNVQYVDILYVLYRMGFITPPYECAEFSWSQFTPFFWRGLRQQRDWTKRHESRPLPPQFLTFKKYCYNALHLNLEDTVRVAYVTQVVNKED